jgi:hypothetical protein
MKIWGQRRNPLVGFTTARKIWIGFVGGCLRNKLPQEKILVAMTIKSDTKKSCGVSPDR